MVTDKPLIMPSIRPEGFEGDQDTGYVYRLPFDNYFGQWQYYTKWGIKPLRLIIGLLICDAWQQEQMRCYSKPRAEKDEAHYEYRWLCDAQAWAWDTWAHASEEDDRHLRIVEV